MTNFWPVGSILAGIVTLYFVYALPPSIGWRFAFALGAIIALFSVWARKALPESPRWLAVRGELDAAESAAAAIASGRRAFDNRRAAPAPLHESPSAKFIAELVDLTRRAPGRLALGCLLDFSEAAGYYGLFTLLPLIALPHLRIADQVVPWFFIVGNVGAAVGGLVAAAMLDRAGRKVTVTGFYVLAAAAMVAMGEATAIGSTTAVMLAFALANFFAAGGWIAAYPAFSELFPTRRRATGIGFSVAFGRIGAAIAPPALVTLAQRFSAATAFAVLGSFWLLGAVAMVPWCLWGIDGKQRSLEVLAGGA